MSAKLPENAFRHECRLLLHRLAKSRHGLIPDATGTKRHWRLGGKRRDPLPPGLVEAMLARGLLIEAPDGRIRPSAAGLRLTGTATQATTLLGQHALIETGPAPRTPAINRTESPVGWLGSRGPAARKAELNESQLAAAERLRNDFELAQLQSRVTATWHKPIGEGTGDHLGPGELALDARRRFFAALDAVGSELAGILLEVCCLAAGIEQAERRLALPRRAGKAVLKLALTALARHYGLLRDTRAPSRGALRTWGKEGFRPEL